MFKKESSGRFYNNIITQVGKVNTSSKNFSFTIWSQTMVKKNLNNPAENNRKNIKFQLPWLRLLAISVTAM